MVLYENGQGTQNHCPLTAILSECRDEQVEKEKKVCSVHLHMSLAESPLYLILVPNVEIGLDSDDRLAILLPIGGSFVLDVHNKQSTGVEAVGGGRAGKIRQNIASPLGAYIPRRHCMGRQIVATCDLHHQRSAPEDNGMTNPHNTGGIWCSFTY